MPDLSTVEDHHNRLTGTVPESKIRTTEIPRYDTDFATRLLAIPDVSSAVADALDEFGGGAVLDSTALQPLAAGDTLCGPAVTLRYIPLGGDVSSVRDSKSWNGAGDRDVYGLGRPGDVAVMDCSSSRAGAVMGTLSARWALKAGIAGCVVDGAVRDSASILDTGLPVWSAARRPNSARYRYEVIELNGPVSLCGYLVQPGDYIVADIDGVCVIPFFDVPGVVEFCENASATEAAFIDRIDAASSLEELVAGLGSGHTPA
ncbi:RraA family protein [Rhodococcus sp. WS4]|nr:RraA family protein [Rhodococcus sp. WS4]